MEKVFKKLQIKEEEEDLFKHSTGAVIRFIQPPEYQIQITQGQNPVTTY
jgi:hypothetical protein